MVQDIIETEELNAAKESIVITESSESTIQTEKNEAIKSTNPDKANDTMDLDTRKNTNEKDETNSDESKINTTNVIKEHQYDSAGGGDHIPNNNSSEILGKEHFVFIGDSTLRYAYLELIDQHHHQVERLAPSELIHEKYHKNWTSFFQYSTDYFDGAMTCDCQRSEVFNLGTEIENRQYTSPHDGSRYTYLQLYGDNQAHGRSSADTMDEAVISDPLDDQANTPKVWGYMGEDMDKLILEYVAKLKPRPTAIIMNAGLWPNEKIANNMDNIMRAAHEVSGVRSNILLVNTSYLEYQQLVSHTC